MLKEDEGEPSLGKPWAMPGQTVLPAVNADGAPKWRPVLMNRQVLGLDGVLICFSSLAWSPQAAADRLPRVKAVAKMVAKRPYTSRCTRISFSGFEGCRIRPLANGSPA